MDLHAPLEGRGDLARQVYRRIRAAILDGPLRRGDRLPATRELARRLGVSRNTVALAYQWLVADGLVSGRRGAGSFVEGDPVSRVPRRSGAALRARAVWEDIAAPGTGNGVPRYDFGVGVPDVSLFPFDTWRRLLARQLRRSTISAHYGDPRGLSRLRTAIARHVAVARGVRAAPEDVVVTNGAQGAFDLVARILLEPGARVAVEEPGYPRPRLLFASYGARVLPIPVDAAGLDVSALPANVGLVYVTPSHQFPLGMPMSHARRAALLAWAERHDAVILESGQFTRHVGRMRRAYAARHERILRTLEDDFAAWLEPVPSLTGIHLAARLRSGDVRAERELAALVRRAGVRLDRLSAYCAGPAQAGLLLGYGAIPDARIPEGLRRLRECCVQAMRRPR